MSNETRSGATVLPHVKTFGEAAGATVSLVGPSDRRGLLHLAVRSPTAFAVVAVVADNPGGKAEADRIGAAVIDALRFTEGRPEDRA